MPPPLVTAPARRRFQAPLRGSRRDAVPLLVTVPQPDIARPADDGAAVWVPEGGTICVDGRYIRGGMVYIAGCGEPGCAVEPDLPVWWHDPDFAGRDMRYWPTYGGCHPRERAAYLRWLAAGRSDPDACIGYVFLFYYGLERRLIHDLGTGGQHPETETLLAEVRRLHGVYGTSEPFDRYASALLDLFAGIRAARSVEPVPQRPDGDTPSVSLVNVGRLILDGGVPAAWAYEYLVNHSDYSSKSAAARNWPDLLRDLFLVRFAARWGETVEVEPVRSRELVLRYKTAAAWTSHHSDDTVSIYLDDIPDPDATALFHTLAALARECAADLTPYSRSTVSRPADTAEALSKLPTELLASLDHPILAALRGAVADTLDSPAGAAVLWDDLVAACFDGRDPIEPEQSQRAAARRDAAAVVALLAGIGMGMEPDVGHGPTLPKPGSHVVVFPLSADTADEAPSPLYPAGRLAARLVALVASADSVLSPDEADVLDGFAREVLDLKDGERRRIGAYLRWLAATSTTMAGARAAAARLTAAQRSLLGDLLVSVAVCDGQIAPEEIAALVAAFGYAGLDTAEVYRRLHAASSSNRTPAEVRGAGPGRRWATPPAAGASAAVLDRDRVRARIDDTARVETLLADIFAEPPDPADPAAEEAAGDDAAPADEEPAAAVAGLDAEHSALAVAAAAGRDSWTRRELADVAESVGLPMLDGALAEINEAAVEACGEPLIEGDDPLLVNPYAAEEML